jgi:hypothetical protein
MVCVVSRSSGEVTQHSPAGVDEALIKHAVVDSLFDSPVRLRREPTGIYASSTPATTMQHGKFFITQSWGYMNV